MRLIGPCDVGGGDEEDGDAPMTGRWNKLVQGPILENKAEEEHEDTKSPKDGNGRYVVMTPVSATVKPTKQEHRQPVDGP